MNEDKDIKWKRMSFKGNKVWVAFTAQGDFCEQKNKVLIKYNIDQDYEYWIKKESLKHEDQAIPAGQKEKKPKQPKKDPTLGLPPNCIKIFTDGASSGNPGPAGIGALLLYKDNRKEICESIGRATNNIAELTAIKVALASLKRQDLPVRVFTDSSYAIGLLTQEWKPRVNQDVVVEIKSMMKTFKDLELIKVRGHAGIKENEVADFLATAAIKKGPQ